MRSIVSEDNFRTKQVTSWITSHVGPPTGSLLRLRGATTADVMAVETKRGSFVLKLFSHQAFVAERPDRAVHEAAMLDLLEPTDVPAPRLIAVDGDGLECSVPAVLMTRLPGKAGVGPRQAVEMVDIAMSLHSLQLDVPWIFERYNHRVELRPPAWGSDAGLWEECLAITTSNPPSDSWGLIHRDFNSTNFLVDGDRVSGLVDWLSACRGPFGIDAARLRLDLTMDGRGVVADTVANAFRRSGHDVIDPHWDLVDAVDLLPFYEGFEAVDRWEDSAKRERLEGFMRRALGSL